MRIDKLSDSGVRMLHEGVQRALAADDSLPAGKKKFEVRELPDWKEWAEQLEAEMDSRGLDYQKIGW